MHVGLPWIDLEDLFVDRNRTDHEALVGELVGNDSQLFYCFFLASGEHQRIREAEPNLRILPILLQQRVEPIQSAFVVALLEARLDLLERILALLAENHQACLKRLPKILLGFVERSVTETGFVHAITKPGEPRTQA